MQNYEKKRWFSLLKKIIPNKYHSTKVVFFLFVLILFNTPTKFLNKNILIIIALSFLNIGCSTKGVDKKAVEGENKKPNIVFILADDLGYGDVGFNGATKVKTPNMDRIAKEGMIFNNAYSPHSVCTPSRYSLMTGRYAWRTWNGHITVWANDPLLIDTTRVTLPKVLKSVGYSTAIIGKWHLGFGVPGTDGWDDIKGPDYNKELKPGPLEVGFDYFYGIPHTGQKPNVYIENHKVLGLKSGDNMRIVLDPKWKNRPSYLNRIGVPDHKFEGNEDARYNHDELAVHLTEKAVEYIDKQKNSSPFFLYFAHRNTHAPLRPNPKFKGTSEIGVYGDFVNELDWSVGQVLDALDRNGLSENTIVIISSDNGGVKDYKASQFIDVNGHKINGPFFGQKTEAYEGGVHVPLAIRWPHKIKPETNSKSIVALTDFLATIAEINKVSLPWNAGEDSFSFLSEMLGTKPLLTSRESVIVDATSGLFAIRRGPWKFISGQGGGGVHWSKEENILMMPHEWTFKQDLDNPPGQLYNLDEDPSETNNLYYKYPEKVVSLRAELREIEYNGRSKK